MTGSGTFGEPTSNYQSYYANVEFDARLGIENLKVIPDDYEVTVSQKKVFKFSNAKRTYFLALEPSSNI